jgi:CDP-glycerol glycerophosphotransferase (TagB/SpsB family)
LIMFDFFQESRQVQKLITTKYQVVFYAENRYYRQYFNHLLESLQKLSLKICYITSDKDDSILTENLNNTDVFFSKSTLAFAFGKLQADVVIMTMPDLGNYIFRKSPSVKKYVYVFHAMVSSHQQYRHHAFEHYDAVFCVGSYHKNEMAEAEQLYNLPKKDLVDYGYPLLDNLEQKSSQINCDEKKILIAPSWYEQGIFSTCIGEIVDVLSRSTYQVSLRPHPEFIKRNKKAFQKIRGIIQKSSNIQLDFSSEVWNGLLSSKYLITDRSGIAFEYALLKRQAVVFIDTPLKIQNKHVKDFSNIPIENKYRDQLGISVPVSEISNLLSVITEVDQTKSLFALQIEKVKKEILFEYSLQNGINYVIQQLT